MIDFVSHAILTVIAMFVIPLAALEYLAPDWKSGDTPNFEEWMTLWFWWAAATWVGVRSTLKSFNEVGPSKPSNKPIHPLVAGPIIGVASIWTIVLSLKDASNWEKSFAVIAVIAIATVALYVYRWRSNK